jgi:hypothetical protein
MKTIEVVFALEIALDLCFDVDCVSNRRQC